MRRTNILFLSISVALLSLFSCVDKSNETKKSDSSVPVKWKIAIVPTLDCLPFLIADDSGLFQKNGVAQKIHFFTSLADVDTALLGNSIAIAVTDVTRMERLRNYHVSLEKLFPLDTHWQLIANANSRINAMSQLGDKIIGVGSKSASEKLLKDALKSQHLSAEAYPVQVDDEFVRLRMLENKSLDAAMLTEPQATRAKTNGHIKIYDSKEHGNSLSFVVVKSDFVKSEKDKDDVRKIVETYNEACDSLNSRGFGHYKELLKSKYMLNDHQISKLPKANYKKINTSSLL